MRFAFVLILGFATVVQAEAQGDAIPVMPGKTCVVTKLRVTDCRAVRGYTGAPIDGSTQSGSWDGKTWEYPIPEAGAGVRYNYLNGDGLHLTFADDQGFNAVVVRGGIRARLLRDVQRYDDPKSGQLVHEFPGGATTSRAWFEQSVETQHVSFFEVSDGLIADTSFFRVRRDLGDLASATVVPLPTAPLSEETPLAAIGVSFDVEGPTTFTISIADPLNPRLELHGADYAASGRGRVHVICDFPDQVVPAGTMVNVTITPRMKDVALEQYRIPKARAIVEALEHRKHILHALYTPVSEARPWNIWNQPGAEEKYFAQPADTGDALQDRLRPWVREIVMTLDQCRAMDPEGKDPIVRQYHEWIRRKMLAKSEEGIPPFPTKFDAIEGVPDWASLVHQAWMQAREVPKWWLDHRFAPNGEFGGDLGDDTDMFQNYAPFPMLERDGVGGELFRAGAKTAELLEQLKLTDGMNRISMDPLHAYEEGLNHEALMAYWNYGDPVYLERCIAAARSTEPQTMITEKGHRHFRANVLGINEIKNPPAPDREHGTHALMWHPTFIVAWYNRNPLAMRWLTEWGLGWLDHMKPGDYATDVKLPDDVMTHTDEQPFMGGWGMTGSAFMFLADLTGDGRYIMPYTDYFRATGKNTGVHLAELGQIGRLPPGVAVSDSPWNWILQTTGDKRPFVAAIKKDVEELQRFPHMYTTVECFTDRVFLYAMINPAIAYTGGYTTRNKLNLTYAVTWNGFGTDYAALVTCAFGDRLKVLLCNLSDKPITGRARLWRLMPGRYNVFFGPDQDGDDRIDATTRQVWVRPIRRGDEIELTLPPKVVHVLEIVQKSWDTEKWNRADLAISPLELKHASGKVSGVAHNIGAADVEHAVISLINPNGKVVATTSVGKLAAPIDLIPKTAPFEFGALPEDVTGWQVVIDLQDAVPELFEGNNTITIGK